MQQLRSFFDQFFGKRQPGRGHGYSKLLFFLPMVGDLLAVPDLTRSADIKLNQ